MVGGRLNEKKLAPVGSAPWIANERSTLRQLEEQDIEDFAFSARNDLEWLNEHMAELFRRNVFDIAELLKTPGRLRGKTPRTARKLMNPPQERTPLMDVFANQPSQFTPPQQRIFDITPQVSKEKETPNSSRKAPLRTQSPTKSPQKPEESIAEKNKGYWSKDSEVQATQEAEVTVSQVMSTGDSGFWSQSQSTQQSAVMCAKRSSNRKSSGSVPLESERSGQSPHTPKEDPKEPQQIVHPSTPVQEVPKGPEKPKSVRKSPVKASSPTKPAPAAKPSPAESRRSGRLAERARASTDSNVEPESEPAVVEVPGKEADVVNVEEGKDVEEEMDEREEEDDERQELGKEVELEEVNEEVAEKMDEVGEEIIEKSPSYSIVPQAQSTEPATMDERSSIVPPGTPIIVKEPVRLSRTPARSPIKAKSPQKAPVEPVEPPPESDDESVSKSSSEESTPKLPLRKSSLNFASLPAREPLTSKKKSLGPKAVRESNLEQVFNGTNRPSWMNRKGNGKSLGATSRQIEVIEKTAEENSDEGEGKNAGTRGLKRPSEEGAVGRWRKKSRGSVNFAEEPAEKVVEELEDASEGEARTQRTQRLRDGIQKMLGTQKSGAPRPARSFPSQFVSTDNAYLPQFENDESAPASKRPKSDPQGQIARAVIADNSMDDDEDDWIPKPAARSQFEQIQTENTTQTDSNSLENPLPRKETEQLPSTGREKSFSESPFESHTPPLPAPIRTESVPSVPASPAAPSRNSPVNTKHTAFVGDSSPVRNPHPEVPEKQASNAPPSPSKGEGKISAVKAHTTNVFKKAKEMLIKSSAASASAKMETLSQPMRVLQDVDDVLMRESPTRGQESAKDAEEPLYPDLTSMESRATREVSPIAKPTIEQVQQGRHIRNSRSRANTHEKEVVREPTPVEATVEPVREGRQARNSKSREADREATIEPASRSPKKLKIEMERERQRAKEEERRLQEERLRKEKEELRRKQEQEELRIKEELNRKPKELETEFEGNLYASEIEDDGTDLESNRGRVTSSAEPERPHSRLQKGSRFQKTTDNKRPVRPTKEPSKPKPAPVSIRIGTASQREMQDQRNKANMAPSGPALVSALKSSFDQQSSQSANQGFNPSASTSSMSSSGGPSKQLKSLTAAENQLKKELEEKERKAARKREIERRRQENQRRAEEARKVEEQRKQPAKKQITTGSTSTGKAMNTRMQPIQNLRQKSEEPAEKRPDYQAASIQHKANVPKGSAKRAFEQPEEQQFRYAPRTGGPSTYQQGTKKRRTEEHEDRGYEPAPSLSKKDTLPKAAPFSHGYVSAAASVQTSSSMMRPPTKPGLPHVDGVKFSKDKIKFAGEPAGPSTASASAAASAPAFKTPGAKSAKGLKTKTPAGMKDSPLYPNGESIELPEIPTDSEDEDEDYYPPKQQFNVPQWAESPELRQLLRQQQTIEPEEIFGPMAKLDMDAIFQNRTDRQAARFRSRTSSANWSGADRLTAAEIEADQEARRRMIEHGGWTYNPPPN